jgi:hypothetical protein
MKYIIKESAEMEQAVQKVEALMNELGLKLDGCHLNISYKGTTCILQDIENGEGCSNFPRFVESERLVLPETFTTNIQKEVKEHVVTH